MRESIKIELENNKYTVVQYNGSMFGYRYQGEQPC